MRPGGMPDEDELGWITAEPADVAVKPNKGVRDIVDEVRIGMIGQQAIVYAHEYQTQRHEKIWFEQGHAGMGFAASTQSAAMDPNNHRSVGCILWCIDIQCPKRISLSIIGFIRDVRPHAVGQPSVRIALPICDGVKTEGRFCFTQQARNNTFWYATGTHPVFTMRLVQSAYDRP